jgi:hypothetical protein
MEKRSSIGLQDALRVFRMTLRNHSQVSSISLSSPKKPNGARRAFHSAFPFKVIPEAEAFEAVFALQAPGGFPRALPDVALPGALWVSDRIGFLFTELDFTAFDLL